MKPMVKIENWELVNCNDPYTPPEQMKVRLQGEVYGHPNHEDGKRISTSLLIDLTEDHAIAITQNTIYELGEMKPEYKAWLEEYRKENPLK